MGSGGNSRANPRVKIAASHAPDQFIRLPHREARLILTPTFTAPTIA
jgi:hypothetical protein